MPKAAVGGPPSIKRRTNVDNDAAPKTTDKEHDEGHFAKPAVGVNKPVSQKNPKKGPMLAMSHTVSSDESMVDDDTLSESIEVEKDADATPTLPKSKRTLSQRLVSATKKLSKAKTDTLPHDMVEGETSNAPVKTVGKSATCDTGKDVDVPSKRKKKTFNLRKK